MYWKLICLFSFIFVFGFSGSIADGQENQFYNSEFDDGLNAWGSYGTGGHTIEVVQSGALSGNNAVLIDITDASATTSIGIYQGISQLVQGQTYPFGFIAKSDQEREMVVLVQLHKPEVPSWNDIVLTRVQLTPNPQKYVLEYTHDDEGTAANPGWSVVMYLMLKGQWWGMVGDDLNTKVWIDRVYFGAEPEVQDRSRAVDPDPADGAIHADTWVNLSWMPGEFALSHDVYLGENFDDVNDGAEGTFVGNQPVTATSLIVGFPGYAYPDGLVLGTTYYWRIDEVNDADPNSPWKGPVWSFTVPFRIAFDPSPPDGAKFVDPNVIISWGPGFDSVLHTVYFGDNFDDVNNAVVGLLQAETTYTPGTLELEKTYYWRVDEFSGAATEKGDIWSFTVTKPGGGLKAEYFNNRDLSGEPVLIRIDPEIDFSWGFGDVPGENSPDPSIDVDNFSARWSGELEVDITDTYTFHITANNGFRLWLDGELIIDFWDNAATNSFESEPIELVRGDLHSIQMEYFEGLETAVAQLFWESSKRQQQIIPSGALQLPLKASSPNPSNHAVDVEQTQILGWSTVEDATSHQVYLGTDEEAVKNADTSSPQYKGSRNLGSESYDPGQLQWGTTYYWRVDEVRADGTLQMGNVWSFTTANFFVVDDFEDYDAGDNQIWFAWHDGLGAGVQGSPDYIPGNGTGSEVGDGTSPSYTEESIVHGGSQSMPYTYDNNKQGFAKYSEAELTLTAPRDWTEEGVGELSLWFRGYPGSVGSFVEGPVGTYTMTGSGADIWNNSDEFHFAFKTLSGVGSIVARVQSVENTHNWAKAGVMIRETLDADSVHAMMVVTPAEGVSFQRRNVTAGTSADDTTGGISAPHWVKIERDLSGNFTAYHSTNGSTWERQGLPDNISMGTNVYIGLVVVSTNAALTCQAVFSNVTTTGTVGPQWANQDIGIASNAAEPLYVAVSNSTGTPAVVVHDDPAAATIDKWTEWVIPLQSFADQGVDLTDVDRIAIGFGTRGNLTIPGGSGRVLFDDIRLY